VAVELNGVRASNNRRYCEGRYMEILLRFKNETVLVWTLWSSDSEIGWAMHIATLRKS